MAAYIKRQDAINLIESAATYGWDKQQTIKAMKKIDKEDVAPVVHGKWIYDHSATDWGIGGYICSECRVKNNNLPCNKVKNVSFYSGSKYCPNCGAKMDGG